MFVMGGALNARSFAFSSSHSCTVASSVAFVASWQILIPISVARCFGSSAQRVARYDSRKNNTRDERGLRRLSRVRPNIIILFSLLFLPHVAYPSGGLIFDWHNANSQVKSLALPADALREADTATR